MTGEGSDIDVGDLLDYLAEDDDSAAILLCLERISCPRKFLSAGRAAARGKPVIVMKVGRDPVPDADLVFDTAVRRAGMLRVYATEDLFDAVETLARARPHRGERMAVLTNGAGLGLIAADALASGDAPLARLSDDTLARLKQVAAPQTNPVDLLADAPVERYTGALDALLREPQADALLFLHAPTAMVPSRLIAEAVAPQMRAAAKNVLSCWLGGSGVAEARKLFADAGLATYDTPEKAVNGFLQIVQYRRNQDLLMEVPASLPPAPPQRWAARAMVSAALAVGHASLSRADTHSLLAAYGITLADSGAGPCEATLAAGQVRVASDAVFGPVVIFGQGGVAARLSSDRVAGLPPLNTVLARDMVERTRVARLLSAGSGERMQSLDPLCRMLVQVSEMVAEIPELAALDFNPVLLEGDQALVLEAQIHLAPARADNALAIRPYPQELEQEVDWNGAPLLLRPIRPEDAPQHVAFFAALAPEDVRLRFFSAMRELPPAQLARLTQIDYDRAMAFIATRTGADGQPETLGVVRAVADPDNLAAEFAIITRSDLKGLGLGKVLFQKLVDYFRSRGTGELTGEALQENAGVQNLVRRFGGVVLPHPEPDLVTLRLVLR
jgi:acetyl-CoA synthetase (ADP-forming)/acetyltransferase